MSDVELLLAFLLILTPDRVRVCLSSTRLSLGRIVVFLQGGERKSSAAAAAAMVFSV